MASGVGLDAERVRGWQQVVLVSKGVENWIDRLPDELCHNSIIRGHGTSCVARATGSCCSCLTGARARPRPRPQPGTTTATAFHTGDRRSGHKGRVEIRVLGG